MTDSKEKTQALQTKTLSNSLRLKSPSNVKSRQNVSNILNRLPYLRTLNETQNQLLKITPIWQQWCTQQSGSPISGFASPANLDGNILSISCQQSSTATILKHSKGSLLKALNDQGFEHIQSVRIQMSLSQKADNLNNNIAGNLTHQNEKQHSNAGASRKPSAASLKSIESTQSLVKNEQLAASLKRLAETLKRAT